MNRRWDAVLIVGFVFYAACAVLAMFALWLDTPTKDLDAARFSAALEVCEKQLTVKTERLEECWEREM